MALDFIYTHNIGYKLGWGVETTYRELAKAHELDEEDVKRMLRLSMAFLLFDKTADGMVVHTAPSFALATNTGLSAWIGLMTKENWPPMLKIAEVLAKYPGSQEQLESAYAMAHNLVEPPFKTWEKDPPRIKRFAEGVEYIHAGIGFQPLHVLQGNSAPDLEPSTFVDVGGSKGYNSAQTLAVGEQELPDHLRDRVQFTVHNLWTEQPLKHADVYFFRMIFHDWSDKYCAEILRSLIPALKKGAKIIIYDFCLPPKGAVSLYQERWLSDEVFTNGKERDTENWAALFGKADNRFIFLGVRLPPGSKEAIVEAVWAPDAKDPSTTET
ncbi:putative hydroxyindole O-methyltransferase [Lophiotrema nucula]|uniref:Putative hydroxyindole O-methyltransferase n=1 Tax=Lophiotrema nucula TaxID=690887 RepID=A0A6A5YVU8_9PLEO|nr:putative hydroxyindole O-methyltransferase [Lophiotrema nucula]